MDVNEIWEENKRWILGVLFGLLAFWVIGSILDGLHDPTTVQRRITAARRSVQAEDGLYDREALAALTEERREVAEARRRLEDALRFEPSAEFNLEGKGVPALHLDEVSRRVKRSVLDRADALGIDLLSKDVDWPSAEGTEQIRETLLGLALLEQGMHRLLDAHERVREADVEALGVVAIESFQVVPSGGRGRGSRFRSRRGGSGSPIEEAGIAQEAKVRFQIRADEPSVRLFLESLRGREPRVALGDDFEMTVGTSPGDPLLVRGSLAALRLQEREEEESR